MLLALFKETRNFFAHTRHDGAYAIRGGALSPVPDGLLVGQYIAVTGAMLTSGVYKLGADGLLLATDGGAVALPDEAFTGTVYGLAVPAAFVQLAGEVKAYAVKNPVSGLVSESFEGYSQVKAQGAHGALTWQEAYAARLLPYRRMFPDVRL